MCSVSMIADHYRDKFTMPDWSWVNVHPLLPNPAEISRNEFDALKREVTEMKALLEKAVDYDKRNNQPHCETEEKLALLRQIAKLVGVELPV